MAKYLVTYHGAQPPSDPAVMEQARAAFGQWLQSAGGAVLDPGAPTRFVEQVSNTGQHAEVEIGGYSILETSSKDDVVRILQSHPFVARGGSLQIHELMTT